MSSSQHQCWIWCSDINRTHEIGREEHISSNICQSLFASLPFYTLVVPYIAPPFKVKGFDVLSGTPSHSKLGILAWNGNSCSEEPFLAVEQQQRWSGTIRVLCSYTILGSCSILTVYLYLIFIKAFNCLFHLFPGDDSGVVYFMCLAHSKIWLL